MASALPRRCSDNIRMKSYVAYWGVRTKTLHDCENNRCCTELTACWYRAFASPTAAVASPQRLTRLPRSLARSPGVPRELRTQLWRRARHDAGRYKFAACSLAVTLEIQL